MPDAPISIAMATHNGARFLTEQLDSLARQTVLPAELIVTDDASTDDTPAILDAFAKAAPFPTRIVSNRDRLGYRLNFMRAASLCAEEIVAFCDQDDVWGPHKLARVAAAFANEDVAAVFHNVVLADDAGSPTRVAWRAPAQSWAPLDLPPWRIVLGMTLAFRRGLKRWAPLHARSIDAYDPSQLMAHDQWFVFLASIFGRIVYLDAPLANYRQHGANLYGWHEGGRLAEARWNIRNAAVFADGAARAAARRADLLSEMRVQDPSDPRIEAALEYYEILRERLRARLQLYGARSPLARARSLAGLFAEGAYTDGSSRRFGPSGLLLDLAVGVPFGPALTQRVKPPRDPGTA